MRSFRRLAISALTLASVMLACSSPSDPNHACAADSTAAACTSGARAAWPGSDDVRTVDATSALGGNVSGLTYEGAGASPAVLWAVRNDPGTLIRLVASGGVWGFDANGGWSAGRALRYPDNSGNPDAEGVTLADGGALGGVYVVAERNNSAGSTSRNSILRYDISQGSASLRATHEWDLTNDLPRTDANLGVEAITWIPDSMLVANGFVDESTGQAYRVSSYASHGTGLFFVGLEADGNVYAYALNHATGAATRVATIVTGFTAVMGMEYDRDTGLLWIICDNHCANDSGVLSIGTAASGPAGKFRLSAQFTRPSSLPDINNEGFALAPRSECVANRKPAFWADDDNTGGHALRSAGIPCGAVALR